MFPYYFRTVIYEFDEANTYRRESGLGMCDGSYADAARKIEEYYGEDLISIDHLEIMEESDIIILPDEVCKKVVHDEYFGLPPVHCDSDGNIIAVTVTPPANIDADDIASIAADTLEIDWSVDNKSEGEDLNAPTAAKTV